MAVTAGEGLSATVAAEVRGFLDRFEECWASGQVEAVAELWDASEPDPWYAGEEVPAPLRGTAQIRLNFERVAARLEASRVSVTDVWCKRLADDLVLTLFTCEWWLVPRETRTAWTGRSRVTAILRRTLNGPRFIHLMEDAVYDDPSATEGDHRER